MVHPEHIEAVAERAYRYFRSEYPANPEWADLPEPTRIKWRDNVVAADNIKAPKRYSEVFQEQCVFKSVGRYYDPPSDGAPAEETQNVPIEAALAGVEIHAEFGPEALQPTPPPEPKPQPKTKRR